MAKRNWKLVVAVVMCLTIAAWAGTTMRNLVIVNSTIDGTVIGGGTPAAGTFTTAAATGLGSSTATLCTTTGGLITNSGCANGFTSGNNSNGYWVKDPTGTVTQRGSITVTNSGGTLTTGTITFPATFGTALDSLIVNGGTNPDGSNDAITYYTTSGNTSGATVVARCAVNIGGSGCTSISNVVTVYWIAIGR